MKRGLLMFAVSMVFLLMVQAVTFAEPDYDSWIGQKIVFLPQPPQLQKYGYQSYSYKLGSFYPAIPYSDLAGKIATIVSISERSGILDGVFLLEDGTKIYGAGYGGNFDNIAFVSELENAKQYIGKAVWHKTKYGHNFLWNYDRETGKSIKVPIANLEQFSVVDIQWGYYSEAPLEFVLRRQNGELISWYGSFSRINDTSNHLLDPFAENWYFTDPKTLHPDWSEGIWHAIHNFEIAIGMTKEMVEMSWGKPKKINRTITKAGTHEQWVYGDGGPYVYFDNNEVTVIQD